jgi:hypothetical protein
MGRSIRLIDGLWALQLFQLVLVMIAPAVFASTCYSGLVYSAQYAPNSFAWTVHPPAFGIVRGADICIFFYLTFYVIWTLYAFQAPKGKMPEIICIMLAICGFLFVFPMYFSMWYNIIYKVLDTVEFLVIFSLFMPIAIALAQSTTSAFLYVAYLPWFMFLVVFFLVYIPSYSFARLWDTSWGNSKPSNLFSLCLIRLKLLLGNRDTGADNAIVGTTEAVMKTWTFYFILALISINILLTYLFIKMVLYYGNQAKFALLLILFSPMVLQIFFSFLFFFVAIPLRSCISRNEQIKQPLFGNENSSSRECESV